LLESIDAFFSSILLEKYQIPSKNYRNFLKEIWKFTSKVLRSPQIWRNKPFKGRSFHDPFMCKGKGKNSRISLLKFVF